MRNGRAPVATAETQQDESADAAIDGEIRYLLEELRIFFRLRDETDDGLARYGERLIKEAAACSGADSGEAPATRSRRWLRVSDALASGASALIRIAQFLSQIPRFMIQSRIIERLSTRREPFSALLLATASNRLHSLEVCAGPRRYLSLLASDFCDTEQRLGLDERIATCQVLFVCEPLWKCPLWTIGRRCRDEGVIILDAGFLLFLGLTAVLTRRQRLFWRSLNAWKSQRGVRSGGTSRTVIDIFLAIVFVEGYRRALAAPCDMQASFFTSNSFVTELLRFYLFMNRRCSGVCEIMHGVPTNMYERYLADMLRAGSGYLAAHKHSSVAQIPALPMFGILLEDVRCGPGQAINMYLNRYCIERYSADGNLAVFLEDEYGRLSSLCGLTERTLVVTFVGGMSQHRDCFRSDTFRAECFLMRLTKRILDAAQQPYVILYTPHPGYPLAGFKRHELFSQAGITLYPDTIFTWFLSDMCLSLISSALFEAAWFGAHAFTPTIPDDDMYPDVLLDLLHHPQNGAAGTLLASLTRFLQSHSNRPPVDLLARVQHRASRFSLYSGRLRPA